MSVKGIVTRPSVMSLVNKFNEITSATSDQKVNNFALKRSATFTSGTKTQNCKPLNVTQTSTESHKQPCASREELPPQGPQVKNTVTVNTPSQKEEPKLPYSSPSSSVLSSNVGIIEARMTQKPSSPLQVDNRYMCDFEKLVELLGHPCMHNRSIVLKVKKWIQKNTYFEQSVLLLPAKDRFLKTNLKREQAIIAILPSNVPSFKEDVSIVGKNGFLIRRKEMEETKLWIQFPESNPSVTFSSTMQRPVLLPEIQKNLKTPHPLLLGESSSDFFGLLRILENEKVKKEIFGGQGWLKVSHKNPKTEYYVMILPRKYQHWLSEEGALTHLAPNIVCLLQMNPPIINQDRSALKHNPTQINPVLTAPASLSIQEKDLEKYVLIKSDDMMSGQVEVQFLSSEIQDPFPFTLVTRHLSSCKTPLLLKDINLKLENSKAPQQ